MQRHAKTYERSEYQVKHQNQRSSLDVMSGSENANVTRKVSKGLVAGYVGDGCVEGKVVFHGVSWGGKAG